MQKKASKIRYILSSQIFLIGHPIIDLIKPFRNRIANSNILRKLENKHKDYALTTVHRRENITNKEKISDILIALDYLAQKIPIMFPCYPHTELQIIEFELKISEEYKNNPTCRLS